LGEVGVIEVLGEKCLMSLIESGVAVYGEDFEAKSVETLGHCAWAGTEIEGATAHGRRVDRDVEDEVVQARRCGSSDHTKNMGEARHMSRPKLCVG
jgi:carotenoid cleavage dioxygenase-like enzyme